MSQPVRGPSPRAGKILVQVFAADPRGAIDGDPLRIDQEVREVREMVDGAPHRDAIDFDIHLATRTKDLMRVLEKNHPQVVHFSGHGENDGLVLEGRDGQPHLVPVPALARLFELLRGDIKVVVLNACFSYPQAKAIADAIGCAIGTHSQISDEAATIFGGTFYSAIASGHSVKRAFELACTALSLDRIEEDRHPQLVARPGLDPAEIYLIPHQAESAESPPPEPAPPERFTPAARVEPAPSGWIFPAIVWMLSLAGSLWLVQSDVKAIALSVVALLYTFALLYLSRSGPARGLMRVRAIVIASACITVIIGAKLLNSGLDTAKRLYATQSYGSAFARFRELAQDGDPEAKGFLGIMYMNGWGTAENDSLGIYWLGEAAQDGDARGMYALGIAYERGEGVSRDARQALRWYQGAARKGHAEARNKVGELYRLGLPGIVQSHDSALVWYGRAAHEGSMDAMSNLALMHERGYAGTANPDEALRWHRRAARAGFTRGMVDLGWVHEHGIGVRVNPDSAEYWYRAAAEAGDKYGMNNLAVLYVHGRGVPRDTAQAIGLFTRAAALELAEADSNLLRLGVRRP